MLYIDNYYQFSKKISHPENGDKAFSIIFDTSPSGQEKIAIFCVMDGVSKSDGAEKSSLLASKIIRQHFAQIFSNIDDLIDMDETGKMKYFFSIMKNAILSADRLLWDEIDYLACTASIAIVFEEWVYTANIGDSPIYLYDNMNDSLVKLFTCHNVASEKIRSGEITKEEAMTYDGKNRLTKVVGGRNGLLVDSDVSTMKHLLPQDGILLLGSDGALSQFSENILSQIISSNHCNMRTLSNSIYEQVVAENGKDDTTLIATRICIGY